MLTDTIVALATPPGTGALAIVRLSGPEVIRIVDRVFRPSGKIAALASHTCGVGEIVDGNESIDQVVATVFRSPRSYTGEDCIEISCHGGFLAPSRILNALQREGARCARAGEFTLRAFLNGKMDLAQAEAVAALISARSAAGARAAFRVLGGGLRRSLEPCLAKLTEALALIESSLDIQEDGAADVLAQESADLAGSVGGGVVKQILAKERVRLKGLLGGGATSRLLEEGIRIALVGKPNAGKSSIFNAILSRERAITSPAPGTTRDTIQEWIECGGFPVALMDTAGLGSPKTPVEQEGVRRTREAIAAASVAILVVDVSSEDPGDLEGAIADLGVGADAVIVALHKWDLGSSPAWKPVASRGRLEIEGGGAPRAGSAVSGSHGENRPELAQGVAVCPSSVVAEPGVDPLMRVVRDRLAAGVGDPEATLLIGERQRRLLAEAHAAVSRAQEIREQGEGGELVAFELRQGLEQIGEILGRRVGPLVLDQVFSRFCVGK